METNQGNGRVRYTEEEIKEYLEQWKSSGKSQISFSKEVGLNYYTFNKWLSDQKRKGKSPKEKKSGFSALKVMPQEHSVFAELKREGYSVLIYQSVSADYIRALLK